MRRPSLPLLVVFAVCAVAASGCAGAGTAAGTPSAAGSPSASSGGSTLAPDGSCAALATELTLAEQVGQLVMVGVTGSLDAAERAAIRDTQAGSVILVGTSTAGVAGTRELTDEVSESSGMAGMLIAADQEGGRVQRLRGPGFDTIPPASEQADLAPAELTAQASAWGHQLSDAGVHLNLAPVADVVPEGMVGTNEPIGKLRRGYGSDPASVGEHVAAFIAGMHEAGVATSAKHFPNLGHVVGNTDFTEGVTDTVTTADDPALDPFRAAIEAGTETVMMSTATYTRLDPDAPAAYSPTVVGLLREDLGFTGVVVSDDVGAAKAVADVPPAERLVRFVRAGGDLAISVEPDVATAMAADLADAAASDADLRARIAESAARVVALKGGLGLADCQPTSVATG